MTQPANTQEPSMEEILASIRRIISDDEAKPAAGAAPAAAARPEPPKPDVPKAPPTRAATALNPMPKSPVSAAAPRPPPPAAKNNQDEIDAMMAGFDGPKAAHADANAPADDDVFELTEQMAMPELPVSSFRHVEPDDDLEFTEGPAQRSAVSAPSFATASLPRAEMLSNTTVSAVESAFNALASTVLSNNARTLEDLVKEMLRPMLKSWLDDNLPNMVERIVKAEIERVSRGR